MCTCINNFIHTVYNINNIKDPFIFFPSMVLLHFCMTIQFLYKKKT